MSDKNILENCGTLESVPNRKKTHEMCGKAVDNYVHALEFVPDYCKAQKCVINLPLTIRFAPGYYNTIRLKKCFWRLLMHVLSCISFCSSRNVCQGCFHRSF